MPSNAPRAARHAAQRPLFARLAAAIRSGAAEVMADLVALGDGGAIYTFDCIDNTGVMRQALEVCHRDWGGTFIAVAISDRENLHPPVPNWSPVASGRVSAVGGAKGRTDVPKFVDR